MNDLYSKTIIFNEEHFHPFHQKYIGKGKMGKQGINPC